MRKILILLIFLMPTLFFGTTKIIKAFETEKIYFHYYSHDSDYQNLLVHVWFHGEVGEDISFALENPQDFNNINGNDYSFGGVVAVFVVGDFFGNVGFIIKKANVYEGTDRFADTKWLEKDSNNNYHVYICQNQVPIGISRVDKDNHMPDRRLIGDPSFVANESTISGISIKSNYFTNSTPYTVLDSRGIEVDSGLITSANQVLTTSFAYDIEKIYTMNITTSRGVEIRQIFLNELYDTELFQEKFNYDQELGVIHKESTTIFRLWAPNIISANINFYNTSDYRIPETPEVVKLNYSGKGVYEIELPKSKYLLKFYTFTIFRLGRSDEIVDPYAYSTGLNGLRAQVVDFSLINEEINFVLNNRPDTISSWSDYIVYELHIRDLTTHSSWNGNEEHRGKFLGLTDVGTTYQEGNITVKTGIDHIKELGINAIQLLPIFDNAIIDETRLSDPNYNQFNWGYMPDNYNALEGSFASNQLDGITKIKEFKEMMAFLTGYDLRVIMDVVYNHTGKSYDSNLYKILPGYYHRMKEDGSFYNGSGCLNETASERPMMRKFMMDSLKFWATEYNISGFRFDLMGLHDIETINLIVEMLEEIDPTIVVYGEPWTGGETGLNSGAYDGTDLSKFSANYNNLYNLKAGAFNDKTRNALKGDGDGTGQAFVTGDPSDANNRLIRYGITGGSVVYDQNPGNEISSFPMDPKKVVNYVSAHDNFTLRDRIKRANPTWTDTEIASASVLANGTVLLSEGIAFIHAGAEILRSKVKAGYNDLYSESARDSYDQPDIVNQLRYDEKIKYQDTFAKYKELINIRKSNDCFRLDTREKIVDRVAHYYELNNSYADGALISYKLLNSSGVALWVIISSSKAHNVYLGNRNYEVLNPLSSDLTGIKTGSLVHKANRITVLKEKSYNVTFNYLDGKTATNEYKEGSSLAIDFEYQTPKNQFVGWYLDSALKNQYVASVIVKDLVLYAKYQIMLFVNSSDGMFEPFYTSSDIAPNSLIEMLETPIRGNQTFMGWQDSSGLIIDSDYLFNSDELLISAKWGITVTLVVNGTEKEVLIEVGNSLSSSITPESIEGYWFTGYYDENNEVFNRDQALYNPTKVYLTYIKKIEIPAYLLVIIASSVLALGITITHFISKKMEKNKR